MEFDEDEFEESPFLSDEEIPTIDEEMISREVDFEEGMNPVPIVSILLGVACLIVFFFQIVGGTLADLDKLIAIGALSSKHVLQGEIWRVISAGFLHGSPDHIFGNLVVLYILGMGCEHAFGRGQTLFLYVAAMIVGSLFSLTGGRVSVGASGAIFGLMGGMISLFMRHRSQLVVRDHRIGFVLVAWAGYQFFIGMMSPSVDNLCHLGGWISGMAVGYYLQPAVLLDRSEIEKHNATLLMLSIALLILIVASMFFIPRLFAAL